MALKRDVLGETLTRHYRLSCELFNTYPRAHFTHQLSQGSLQLQLDNIDLDHLEALCHTIKNKVSPLSLRVIVPTEKKALGYPMMTRVVERAVEGVGVCMVASLTLTLVTFDGVKIRGRNLKLMCEGLRRARSLKTLIMRNCSLGDSGTESVCQAVKNVPSITHLSLVNCGLAERGGTSVASLIKHQRLNRDSAMWQDTLRQREPHLDGMKGLRRLTLNSNPSLGDAGVAPIAEALTEDLWIKAIDLQHCGVGVEGGVTFQTLLCTNQSLEVVDLRNNPFLPDSVLGDMINLLQTRRTEASSQYSWLKTSEVEEGVEDDQRERSSISYKASGRVTKGRRGSQLPLVSTSKRPKVPSQLGVPWRVEHRLYERREGLRPGSMVKECITEWESVGEVTQPSKESVVLAEVKMKKMRKKLRFYKKKYHREREQRRKLERKLSHIQTQLKGLHTLDEHTLSHIEECFLKFHIFLSMMQNSGGDLQTSSPSPGAQSRTQHPPVDPDCGNPPSGNSFHPETFHSPSTIPLTVTQPFNSTSHALLIPHIFENKQGGNVMRILSEPRMDGSEGGNGTNQGVLRVDVTQRRSNEGAVYEDPRVNVRIMTSDQDHKAPSTFARNQEENKKEMTEHTTDRNHEQGMKEEMKAKRNKEKDSKGTKDNPLTIGVEKDYLSPSNTDYVAMRVEFIDQSEGTSQWNGGMNKYTYGMSEGVSEHEKLDTIIPEATFHWSNGMVEIDGRSGRKTKAVSEDEKHETMIPEALSKNGMIKIDGNSGRKTKAVIEYSEVERIIKSKELPLRTVKIKNPHPQFKLDLGEGGKGMDGVLTVPVSESGTQESRTSELESSQSPARIQLRTPSQFEASPSFIRRQSPVPSQFEASHSPISKMSPVLSQFEASHSPIPKQSPVPSQFEASQSPIPRQSPIPSHSVKASQLPITRQSPIPNQSKHSQVHKHGQILKECSTHEKGPFKKEGQTHKGDVKETQIRKQGPLSSAYSPQEDSLISKQKPLESQANKHGLSSQENRTSLLQSPSGIQSPQGQISKRLKEIQSHDEKQLLYKTPSVQSPPSPSPYIHSPSSKSLHESPSPQKVTSPQNPHSSTKPHPMQTSNLSPPHKLSPVKCNNRSPRNNAPETQGSEVSETDDEKMRNLTVWLQGRTMGRSSTPSSSSVSISEHLQQSHTSWTKARRDKTRDKGEEEVPGGSEIDLSDLEDLSLSGITLTNTSAHEDLHTPREEDF